MPARKRRPSKVVLDSRSLTAARLIKAVLPDMNWMLKHAEAQGGWIKFPPIMSQVISGLNISNYPELYEDENRIIVCMMFGIFGKTEAKKVASELSKLSIEDGLKVAAEFGKSLDTAFEGESFFPKTEKEAQEVRKSFEALSKKKQKKIIRQGQYLYSSLLGGFYNWLSMMIHGEKLTSLVAQAKAGNDDAYVRAVQIDRNVLTGIKYFKDRYARAQLEEGHTDFLDDLAYRMNNPTIKGKIRYRRLFFGFAMLETMEVLTASTKPKKLLAILDEVGLDRWDNRIQGTIHLSTRLKQYRRFQQRGK